MTADQLIKVLSHLCSEYPDLVLLKHFDRSISGQGDVDVIVPPQLVESVSKSFLDCLPSFEPNISSVIICDYHANVRPHFALSSIDFPVIFQFDVCFMPMRMGYRWCNVEKLNRFSVLNSCGVRVLCPGAQSIVLLMLYGISLTGGKRMKPYDESDFLAGILHDYCNARKFVDVVVEPEIRKSLTKVIERVHEGKGFSESIRNLWIKIFFSSAFINFRLIELGSVSSFFNRKLGPKSHHHERFSLADNPGEYLRSMESKEHRVISISQKTDK